MFEELLLAFVATGVLSVPVYFSVGLGGNLFVFWMAYFTCLSAGARAHPLHLGPHYRPAHCSSRLLRV